MKPVTAAELHQAESWPQISTTTINSFNEPALPAFLSLQGSLALEHLVGRSRFQTFYSGLGGYFVPQDKCITGGVACNHHYHVFI
jgi:hypothetical protein